MTSLDKSINPDKLWHINLVVPSDVDPNKIILYHRIMGRIDRAWPWAEINISDVQRVLLSKCYCRHCSGKPYYNPKFYNQSLTLIKKVAEQLGFSVKIMGFSKHKHCEKFMPGKVLAFNN